MPCSPEQLAANRDNARKSTGPRTEAGKQRSRQNSFKHGLTGAGVVVPDEDRAAVEERFEAFEVDLKPRNAVARSFVLRAALLSIRLERCARNEAGEITRAMLDAPGVEAEARHDEVTALVATLHDDPARAVRKLRRTLEGIEWLLAAWRDLQVDLERTAVYRWNAVRLHQMERLMGRNPMAFGISRVMALGNMVDNVAAFLAPDDLPELPPDERQAAARAELGRIIAEQMAQLEIEKSDFDRETLGRIAATSPARALFGTSKGAILARKYEATAERMLYKALGQVERLNAAAEAGEEVDATSFEGEDCKELGSFSPGPLAGRPRADRGGQGRAKGPGNRARSDSRRDGDRPSGQDC